MNVDDRLNEAFRAKAATASPSPEAWDMIRSRTQTNRRIRIAQLIATAVAVPALAVGGVLAISQSSNGNRDQKLATNPPTPSRTTYAPSPTAPGPGPVVSPTAPTPDGSSPAPTPSADAPTTGAPTSSTSSPTGPSADVIAQYANAIAIGHDGGRIDIVTPAGKLLDTPATLQGRNILDVVWSPSREFLYVSGIDPNNTCDIKAVAIQVGTRNVTELGPWRDFAFAPEATGSKLAVVVQPADCGRPFIGVQHYGEVDTEMAMTPLGTSDADNIGSLAWVPGANRLVLIQYGPGDGNSVLLLDLDKDTAVDQAAMLDGVSVNGEFPDSLAYVGKRLVVSNGCCYPEFKEHVRLVERDAATGKAITLLTQQGWGGSNIAVSPDGKSLLLTPYGTEELYVWDQASKPRLLPTTGRVAGW